jgi:hypothetical protein
MSCASSCGGAAGPKPTADNGQALDAIGAEFTKERLERGEGAFLVYAHQPRIPGDIGRQDRR